MGVQLMMLCPLSVCSVPCELLCSWLLPHIHPCENYQLISLPCLFLLIMFYIPCSLLLWYLLLTTLNLVCIYNIHWSILLLHLHVLMIPVYLTIRMMWLLYHVLQPLIYSSPMVEMLLFPRSSIVYVIPVLSSLILGVLCTKILQHSHTSCTMKVINSSIRIIDCAAILPLILFEEDSCFYLVPVN